MINWFNPFRQIIGKTSLSNKQEEEKTWYYKVGITLTDDDFMDAMKNKSNQQRHNLYSVFVANHKQSISAGIPSKYKGFNQFEQLWNAHKLKMNPGNRIHAIDQFLNIIISKYHYANDYEFSRICRNSNSADGDLHNNLTYSEMHTLCVLKHFDKMASKDINIRNALGNAGKILNVQLPIYKSMNGQVNTQILVECGTCGNTIDITTDDYGVMSIKQDCKCIQIEENLDQRYAWEIAMHQVGDAVMKNGDSDHLIGALVHIDYIHTIGNIIYESRKREKREDVMIMLFNTTLTFAYYMLRLLIDHATCNDGNVNYLVARWMSINPVNKAMVFNNIIFGDYMCKDGLCRCTSDVYGQELKEFLIKIKSSMQQNLNIGNYGECGAAITHCWGDELIISNNGNNIIDEISRQLECKLWVDVHQKVFDPIRCKKEFSGTVIIIEKQTYKCAFTLNTDELLSLLQCSDWGQRGWTAQEINESDKLAIYHNGLIIWVDKHRFPAQVNLHLGCNSTQWSREYYSIISGRKWRRREDLCRTINWWGSGNYTITSLAQSSLMSTNINYDKSDHCWMPAELDMQNKLLGHVQVVEARLHYVGKGRIMSSTGFLKKMVSGTLSCMNGDKFIDVAEQGNNVLILPCVYRDKEMYTVNAIKLYTKVWHISSDISCRIDGRITMQNLNLFLGAKSTIINAK